MTPSRILLFISAVCALVATAFAFGWITADNEDYANPLGWLALAFLIYVVSILIPDRGR